MVTFLYIMNMTLWMHLTLPTIAVAMLNHGFPLWMVIDAEISGILFSYLLFWDMVNLSLVGT